MKNPCYNTETHTDCPKRAVGCSANCPEWASYVKKRDEMRKIQFAAHQLEADLISVKGGCTKYGKYI